MSKVMRTWLDKLCKPLEKPQYPQIRGKLVSYAVDDEIMGKCAEGEIACQNGIKYTRDQILLGKWHFIDHLGVPSDLFGCLPRIHFDSMISDVRDIRFDVQYDSISDYIVGMNDCGFTYPQIVEFLRTTFGDAV